MHCCRLAVRATLPEPSTQLVLLTHCQRERTHRSTRTRHWPVLDRNHGDRPLLERPHLRYRLPARASLRADPGAGRAQGRAAVHHQQNALRAQSGLALAKLRKADAARCGEQRRPCAHWCRVGGQSDSCGLTVRALEFNNSFKISLIREYQGLLYKLLLDEFSKDVDTPIL